MCCTNGRRCADQRAFALAQRLFDYISGQNEKHALISMTAPVLTWVVPGEGCVTWYPLT